MPRTKILTELSRLFDASELRSIDINSYEGEPFDVAFEILTEDTYIAGIASRIIDAERITKQHRKLLTDVRLSGTTWRRRDNGELFDLTPYPEIHSAAKNVEDLRSKSREALSATN